MNKRTVMTSLNKIANELDNNGLHNEADTVTKVMSRLASDMSDFQKDPSGFVGDILDPERKQGDLYGNYMSRHNNKVIDSLNEAIQDMKDDPMISQSAINRVIEIKNNLERIYNSDDDMGPESEPFDYNSPEDEGDMYGDDMTGYMDKDSDF